LISVILYGRNDAHGYNLHRRAALSFNCLAETLTDEADEIIFVDYNTPDELPTFIEAIADTLTERCLGLLRVLRVPAALHHQRFAARTHLAALEPVARNAAVRRANPANRWLLSTNTDMVFLPLAGGSLSDICGELPDGFYGLPRFELPEWLWERLPRSDPRTSLAEIKRLGPRLGLDEPTASHEWIRFDAPGDFQLVLRDDFVAVDGFNEEMLLGWHVDSNLSRRLLLRRRAVESLGDRVAGYHCNHNRVPTIYHGAQVVTNDLYRFFYSVNRAELPEQRETWGLADAVLEEVSLRERVGLQIGDQLADVTADGSSSRIASDAFAAFFDLTYDSEHVLPFVADSLLVSSIETTVGYIGANPVLEKLLTKLATNLRMKDVVGAALGDPHSLVDLDRVADVVVVDLGIDASFLQTAVASGEHEANDFADRFDQIFAALKQFIALERERLERGQHPRRVVLINSAAAFWDSYVLAHLECSHTSPHSRVRRATVKAGPDKSYAGAAPPEIMRRQLRWSARRRADGGPLRIPGNGGIMLADLVDFEGFRDGWYLPDPNGIWTQGRRAELAVTFDGGEEHPVLDIGIDAVRVGASGAVTVEVIVEDERVAVRDFTTEDRSKLQSVRIPFLPRLVYIAKAVLPTAARNRLYPLFWRLFTPASLGSSVIYLKSTVRSWRIELPPRVVARRNAQLTFVIGKPSLAEDVDAMDDAQSLGFHLRSLRMDSR
jgi:hypothetical protein